MCALERPFDGSTRDEIKNATLTKDPERIPAKYTRKLWRICEDMLQKNVSDRLTLREILASQIIIDNAKKHLPAAIFDAEFTNYDPKRAAKVESANVES